VTPLLALFDVDGTLFLTDDPLAGEALLASLRELYAVDLPADAVERVDHRGQTTLRIARAVLRAERLDDPTIDEQLARACALFAERYLELLESADTGSWRAAPGAAEALSRLSERGLHLALLTGNPQPVARARMARLGLERFFPEGRGAFGCDAEQRSRLVEIARGRAGGWPVDRTVEIGDTPRDVSSAHGAGVRAIALRSPRSEDELPEADAVCNDLGEVADVLLAWSR
jgi:phosphoglycolate phosphatase-like HAD superfamily hydrolase